VVAVSPSEAVDESQFTPLDVMWGLAW
jgi:hypothetical protein